MIRTQIYLPEDLYRQLKLLANAKNTNLSTLIRQGAQKIINQHNKDTNPKVDFAKFIGQAKTNKKTNAVKDIHDYYENFV